MDRLTTKAYQDEYVPNKFDILDDDDVVWNGFRELVNRLAAYEDTGLTPDEIKDNMEMFKAYRNICGGKSPEEIQALIIQAEKRWIPISERYPTEKDANSNGLIIAYSAYLMKTTVCTWHHIIDDGVTSHWMPMPELPKEE